MGFLIYNFSICFLYLFLWIGRFFNKKLNLFYKTRKEGYQKIQNFLNEYKDYKKIWLHASSVGELEQALSLYRVIKKHHKDVKILITVFSLSVKNLDKIPSEGKAYLPLDLYWNWNFSNFDFKIFITFTWDTFPNLLKKLKKKNCKTFMNSAAISSNSYRIRYRKLFKFFYQYFDKIGVVDEDNKKNFSYLFDKEKIIITGDSRYDAIFYKLENLKVNQEVKQKLDISKNIIILASTYKACDEELYPHIHKVIELFPKNKIWIFPHHVDEERIKETIELLKKWNLEYLFFSDSNFKEKYKNASIILVDVLGVLAYAYQKAKISYIGGGFHHRIHNTGEPAACGCIPLTGPRIEDSPTAMLLYKYSYLKKCKNGLEVIDSIIHLLTNENDLYTLSNELKNLMNKQRGSSEFFYNILLQNELSGRN